MKRILVVLALILVFVVFNAAGCTITNPDYSGSSQPGRWSACYGNGSVCDSGPGIPGHCPDRVYEGFGYQAIDPGSCH